MKKSLITFGLAFTFLTVATPLSAQSDNNESREVFTFGLKAGINYSNVWDEQGEDFRADAKVGFAGGVFIGIPFGKFLGFQPEFLISQKGFKGAGTLLGTPYSFTRTTTFIDVPLLLQVKPAEFITFVVGPQYSYLAHQKDVYTFGVNSIEQEQEFENDNIRRNILGFSIGADVNIKHFVLSGRAAWDFQSNHGDGSSSTPRYKNQWLQFTVGYRFY
ncbi:MAG: porin family protein [Crocinitomicaceae bacterium]